MIKFILDHFQDILTAIVGLLSALTIVFLLIPGEQPEKTFRAIADFLEKFSMKKDKIDGQ